MVAAAPECFFVPPYVGPSGWIGIWLDGVVEWDDVADFLRDSYRLVAPRSSALLDATETETERGASANRSDRP